MFARTNKPLPKSLLEVELFPQQAYFAMVDDYKYKLFSGGVGTGKSRYAGSYYMIRRAFQNPETIYVVGANSYKQLNQATLRAFFSTMKLHGIKFVVNKRPPASWGVEREWESHNGILTIENGCQILLWSFDRYELIEGIEIGGFWIDETRNTKQGAWLYLTERLRCPFSHHRHGRVTTTPGGRQHWLFKEFSNTHPEAAQFYKIVYMCTMENTTLPPDYINHLLSTIDPKLVPQELGGRYVDVQEGKAYHCWDSQRNGILKYPYDHEKPLIFSFDFNIMSKSPMSTIIGQEHFNSESKQWEAQVIDEIVIQFGDTKKACHEFLARYQKHQGQIHIYGDATGDYRTESEFSIVQKVLGPVFRDRLKLLVKRSNPLVDERIASVNAMLFNSLDVPRLFIDLKRCPRLEADLVGLEFKESGAGLDKSDPLLSHSSDALGYWIYLRFPAGHIRNKNKNTRANY